MVLQKVEKVKLLQNNLIALYLQDCLQRIYLNKHKDVFIPQYYCTGTEKKRTQFDLLKVSDLYPRDRHNSFPKVKAKIKVPN